MAEPAAQEPEIFHHLLAIRDAELIENTLHSTYEDAIRALAQHARDRHFHAFDGFTRTQEVMTEEIESAIAEAGDDMILLQDLLTDALAEREIDVYVSEIFPPTGA